MSTKTTSQKNNFKYLLYMGIVIGFATYSAASADIVLSIVSAAVGGGFFAAVCMRKFHALIVAPMMLIPPLAVYFVTSDLIFSFMSISFLPVGLIVFYGMKKNLTRAQTVVGAIVSLGVFYALVYSSIIVKILGVLNVDAIKLYLEWNFEIIRQYMLAAEKAYVDNGLDLTQYFHEGMLEEALLSFKLSVLGYIIAFLSIVSYAATSIAKTASKKMDVYPVQLEEWKFVFSKTGALVFVFAYLARGMYSADTEGLYFPFAMNTICVSLCPAIVYMGFSKFAKRFRSGARVGPFLILALFLALSGGYIMLFLLIIGLYATFTYKSNSVENAK